MEIYSFSSGLVKVILLCSAGDVFLHTFQLAHLPVAQLPVVFAVGDRIILNLHRRKMAYEFFLLELVEAESVTPLRVVVVVLHIGNYALIYLQLYVFGRSILLLVLVHRLKVLAYYRAVWNHVGREYIAQG